MHLAFSLRHPSWLSRAVLAWAMILAPVATVRAETPVESKATPGTSTIDTTWLTPDCVAVGYLRPRQILTTKNAELLPLEIFDAFAKEFFGTDVLDIESIILVAQPKSHEDEPLCATIVKFNKPYSLSDIPSGLTEHTRPGESNGQPYLRSHTHNPSFYLHKKTILIAAADPTMQKLVQQAREPITSPLAATLKNRPATDDVYLAVDAQAIRPLIEWALAEARADVPPQFQKYFGAIDLVRSAEFAFNLSQATPPLLNVYANDEHSAEQLVALIDSGIAELQAVLLDALQRNRSEDPVEQAVWNYGVRSANEALEDFRPGRNGDGLIFFPVDPDKPQNFMQQLRQLSLLYIIAMNVLTANPFHQDANPAPPAALSP